MLCRANVSWSDILPGAGAGLGIYGTDLPSDARIKIITYELYPGIEISYNYFSADRFHFHHCHRTSALAIDHCCRGRIAGKWVTD